MNSSKLTFLPIAILIQWFLLGCRVNTTYSDDFSATTFHSIQNGTTRKQLIEKLGEPLHIYTYVNKGAEGAFNLDEKVDFDFYPTAKEMRHVYCYSSPTSKRLDFIVYEVFVDKNDVVVGKQTYKDD